MSNHEKRAKYILPVYFCQYVFIYYYYFFGSRFLANTLIFRRSNELTRRRSSYQAESVGELERGERKSMAVDAVEDSSIPSPSPSHSIPRYPFSVSVSVSVCLSFSLHRWRHLSLLLFLHAQPAASLLRRRRPPPVQDGTAVDPIVGFRRIARLLFVEMTKRRFFCVCEFRRGRWWICWAWRVSGRACRWWCAAALVMSSMPSAAPSPISRSSLWPLWCFAAP